MYVYIHIYIERVNAGTGALGLEAGCGGGVQTN